MSAAEHRVLLALLTGILLSIPVALAAAWRRNRRVPDHPQTPPVHGPATPPAEIAIPDDPASPPPPGEPGVPSGHWRAVDGIVALVLVGVLGLLMGPVVIDPEVASGFRLTPDLLLQQLTFQLSMIVLILFYLGIVRRLNIPAIFGFNRMPLRRIALSWILWFLVAMAAFFCAAILSRLAVWLVTGDSEPSQQLIVEALEESPPEATVAALVFLTVCAGAPLMEELIFRGYLFSVAKRFTGRTYAIAGSALFFAITHANLLSFLPLTAIGIVFTLAYERTRCLAVPVLLHASFNLVQICLLLYGPEPPPG